MLSHLLPDLVHVLGQEVMHFPDISRPERLLGPRCLFPVVTETRTEWRDVAGELVGNF